MRPASAASSPAMRRNVVDLPHPDGPSSTFSVPASNANETSSTARMVPSAVVQTLLTRSAAIADIKRSTKQSGESGTRVGCTHERFADQERVDAVAAHLRHVAVRDNAALGHDDPIGGDSRQQLERRMQRHAEGPQVAVVDADQRRRQAERACELRCVVHFDQHVHPVPERARLERREPRVVERSDDQQHGIGAERTRFDDLVLVDDEFLAQHRHRAGVARRRQEFGRTLEERPIGQHRQARRAGFRIRRGDRGRIERGAQKALARTRALDFGDDRRLPGGDAFADCGNESAWRRRRGGIALDDVKRPLDLRRDDLLGLDGHDPREDVGVAHRRLLRWHQAGWPRRFVVATNAWSLCKAAPLPIAARARSMPSPIEPAIPAAYNAVPAFSTTISRGVPSTPRSASSTISFDSAASVTLSPRLDFMCRPKSSGWISYSVTSPSRSSPTIVAAPSETSSMPSLPYTTIARRLPSRCSTRT